MQRILGFNVPNIRTYRSLSKDVKFQFTLGIVGNKYNRRNFNRLILYIWETFAFLYAPLHSSYHSSVNVFYWTFRCIDSGCDLSWRYKKNLVHCMLFSVWIFMKYLYLFRVFMTEINDLWKHKTVIKNEVIYL